MIQGCQQYLWRAVDEDGDVLDILVQSHRNRRAAVRFFRTLLKTRGRLPRRLITDQLRSYAAACCTVMPSVVHVTDQYANNRAEVSHQPTRQRERQMRRFTSAHVQRFASVHGVVQHLFRVGRHLHRSRHHRVFRKRAMAWHPWDGGNTDSLEDVLATDDDPDPTQEDASAPLPESGHMPDWAQDDPRTYWAAADAHERANGRLFRDVEFALPAALPERQRVALAREFAASVTNSDGERLPYTLAVHHGEGENAHAHLMFSERAYVGVRDGGGAGPRPRTAAVLWRQAIEGTLRDFWLAQETAAAVVSSEPRLPPPPVRTQSHCPARRPPWHSTPTLRPWSADHRMLRRGVDSARHDDPDPRIGDLRLWSRS